MIKQMNFSPPAVPGPTAVALGFFDGLHLAHQQVIGRAVRAVGLVPAVFTFQTDSTAPASKRAGLLMEEWQKEELLGRMGVRVLWSPCFYQFAHLSPENFVKQVLVSGFQARLVCCGYNYTFGKGGSAGPKELSDLCEKAGVQCETLPAVERLGSPVSSSRIRQAIGEGDMKQATALLGRPFTLEERVETGRQLGRRLRFPTINQRLPDGFVQPRFGVYASETVVNGICYPSITNVGRKPTVGSDVILAETHLLGNHQNLYGLRVPVSLLEFMRPEQKFPSIEMLQAQVLRDIALRKQMD